MNVRTLVVSALALAVATAGMGAPQVDLSAPQFRIDSAPIESYRLTAKDSVRVTVFQEEDLDTTGRIAKDGTINFPLIGVVKIGGKTVHEASQTLEAQLREYLVKPQVTIAIVEYSKRRFTVLGQVVKPGTYDLPDDSTLNLLEAIGMAGGYTRIANPSKITLKRLVGGNETLLKLDGQSMIKSNSTKRFEVLPGDTIVVGESIW